MLRAEGAQHGAVGGLGSRAETVALTGLGEDFVEFGEDLLGPRRLVMVGEVFVAQRLTDIAPPARFERGQHGLVVVAATQVEDDRAVIGHGLQQLVGPVGPVVEVGAHEHHRRVMEPHPVEKKLVQVGLLTSSGGPVQPDRSVPSP